MEFKSSGISIEDLEDRIRSFEPNPSFTHDDFSMIAVAEAVRAAKEGNIGGGVRHQSK